MNTGIEYNDIRRFVEELTENDFRFVIVNSKVNIPQMLKEKGYPFKQKSIAASYQCSKRRERKQSR